MAHKASINLGNELWQETRGLIPGWHKATPEQVPSVEFVPYHLHRSVPKSPPWGHALSWASLLAEKVSQTFCLHIWLQRNNFNNSDGLQEPASLLLVMPKRSLEMVPTSAHTVQMMQKSLIHGSGPLLNSSFIPTHMAAPVQHYHFSLGWLKTQNSEQWNVFHCTTLSALVSSTEGFTNVKKRTRMIKDPGGFRILNSSEIISDCINLLSIHQSGRIIPN